MPGARAENRRRGCYRSGFLAAILSCLALPGIASEARPRAQLALERFDFERREAMIPMRDGVRLFTLILIPKAAAGQRPIVLERTPYSASAMIRNDNSSPRLSMLVKSQRNAYAHGDFILVFQDTRGKHKSEGDYVLYEPPRGSVNTRDTDHATDAYDTIEWLVKNIGGHNGRVGLIGTSYSAKVALTALLEPHPALKAVVAVSPVADLWKGDDFYHNGALRLSELEFIAFQSSAKESGMRLPFGSYDAYSFYLSAGSASEAAATLFESGLPAWSTIGAHPTYDEFWRERALDQQLARRNNAVPVLTVHSWFDQEDSYGGPVVYSALEASDEHDGHNFLVAGPWAHAQANAWGNKTGALEWGADTARQYRETALLPFLDRFLKEQPTERLAPVLAFDSGAAHWRTLCRWPLSDASTPLYLKQRGALGFRAPASRDRGYDEYVSDPAKPVPYQVRPIPARHVDSLRWAFSRVDDQRQFETRPDVLTYVSEPLTEPVTLAGAVEAVLFASTTGTDADWVVKLIDVFPEEYPDKPALGGYQLAVSGEILRGRYRNSFERPQPIPANVTQKYRIRMPHVFHTVRPGHRLMVQIQSSWFPLYDRNPQTYVDNIFLAPRESYVTARQRIYRTPDAASHLRLPVVAAASRSQACAELPK